MHFNTIMSFSSKPHPQKDITLSDQQHWKFRASMAVEPELKQFWMIGTGARAETVWMVEPEWESEIWVQFPSPSLWGKQDVWISFQWTKSFWSQNQTLLDVGVGAKTWDAWSLSQKFGFGLHSPGYTTSAPLIKTWGMLPNLWWKMLLNSNNNGRTVASQLKNMALESYLLQ